MRRFQYFQNQEIFDAISQAEMSCNHTDDALLTDREYVVQLLEPRSVCRDEIVDNPCGHLGGTTEK